MNAYELTIRGLDNAVSFATARWELFVFPEVYGLTPEAANDLFVIFYEGNFASPTAWKSSTSFA